MTRYSFPSFYPPKLLLCFILPIAIVCSNCGKKDNPVKSDDSEKIDLTAFNEYTFNINNFHIVVDSAGQLRQGELHNLIEPVFDKNYISVIFRAGLWLGTFVNGEPKANIIWVGSEPGSNYTTKWPGHKRGIYFIDPLLLDRPDINWPFAYGLPTGVANQPAIYGDAMCWSVLTSEAVQTASILSQPIPDIPTIQALFAYLRQDLQNILFVRYTIKNSNRFTLNELYAGFYSDTDLVTSFNATGYDANRALSYTYSPGDTAQTYVAGFTVLQTPVENGISIPVSSHRIMRKNDYFDPDFGEYGFETSQQVLYALQGLSNSGLPMVDPHSGNPSKFAFTGDPVSNSGWLDVSVDVRSLLSFGPFSVSPNETKTITVVWIVEFGNNLSEALKSLKIKVDDIRNEPGLWQF